MEIHQQAGEKNPGKFFSKSNTPKRLPLRISHAFQ